jgi:hypothetical protein
MNKKLDPAVLEKLRKIMALAGDGAAHAGEVEAAMRAAKELATRHNLDLATLDLSTVEKAAGAIDIEHSDTTRLSTTYEHLQHRYIYNLISEVFGVKVVLTRFRRGTHTVVSKVHLIGDPFDVALAGAVFTWLEGVFVKTFSRLVSEGKLSKCSAHERGCYSGMARGIIEMNKREEAAIVKPATYALVVRNKSALIDLRMKELFPDMEQPKARPVRQNDNARQLGYQAGIKINLRQVSGSKAAGALAR